MPKRDTPESERPPLKRNQRHRLAKMLRRDLGRSERVFALLRLHERRTHEEIAAFLGVTMARVREIDESLTARAEVENRDRQGRWRIAALARRRAREGGGDG